MKINVFFCDDIRVEIDGRRTYVGVYNKKFEINEEQKLIPRFFVACEVVLYENEKIPSLTFVLKKGDEIISELPLINESPEKINIASGSSHRLEIEITPLIVKPEDKVTGCVKDGETIYLIENLEFIKTTEMTNNKKKKKPSIS